MMKIGFIVECVMGGPESGVLPRLAALINPELECEVEPLGSKPKVLNQCGKYAKALLGKLHCDRVVVLWDARPPWQHEEGVDCDPRAEKAKAMESLTQYQLEEDPRVILICLIEELEAWLLADGRGVTARINELRRARSRLKKRIPDFKKVEKIHWPKAEMERVFRQGEVRVYNDWLDAIPIADYLRDVSKLLKHSKVFPEFHKALSV
jgi:hypothetical protein